MAKRKNDWEAVERDYRIGQLSTTEMAEKHGIPQPSIVRKAKQCGWTRDKTDAVRHATKAKMIRQVVRDQMADAEASVVKDFNEVDLAANVNVTIIMRHQGRAKEISDALDSMIAELKDVSANPKTLEQLVLAVGQEDPLAAAGIMKAQTLPTRMSVAKSASETLAKLVVIERQAFGIDGQEEGQSDEKRTALLIKDLDENG